MSPCSDTAPQSVSVAPGNVLGHSLSLWSSHKEIWGHLEKLIKVVSYSLFSRFCFCQGQVDWWPRERFLFPASIQGPTPLVGRGLPQATTCPAQRGSSFLPPCSNVHACDSWVPRLTFVRVEFCRCCLLWEAERRRKPVAFPGPWLSLQQHLHMGPPHLEMSPCRAFLCRI